MKSFVFAACLGIAAAFETEDFFPFTTWAAEHGKQYTTVEEFEFRMEIFLRRHKAAQAHNAGNHSWTRGTHSRSDMTQQEMSKFLNYRRNDEKRQPSYPGKDYSGTYDPVDWRGCCVNAIKDQGGCGSCWAFSSTATLETRHQLIQGTLESFSEQQLVDCVYEGTHDGCEGGGEDTAFNYLKDHDILREADYPYTSGSSATWGSCAYNSMPQTGIRTEGMVYGERQNVDAYKHDMQWGPLSQCIAVADAFFDYSGGIFDSTDCAPSCNHAIALVGWGTEGGREYWILRNSWGTTWGEQGYAKVAITGNDYGICGVQDGTILPVNLN